MRLNTELFKAINGLAYRNLLLDKSMIIFSKYVYFLFIAVLGVFYIYGVYSRNEKIRCISVNTFVFTVINLCLSFIIGTFYYVPRPFVTGKVNLLMSHAADASFPSDHAVGTMSIAAGINNYNKVYGRILVVISCLVGLSRVYVGNHYPADVIGGYLIVFAANYLYGSLLKGKVEYVYLKAEKALAKYVPVSKAGV